MTDVDMIKSMTDAEIIQAFKCCNTENGCKECILSKNGSLCDPEVHSDFIDSVLDLINRQKAEIERLKSIIKKIETFCYALCTHKKMLTDITAKYAFSKIAYYLKTYNMKGETK